MTRHHWPPPNNNSGAGFNLILITLLTGVAVDHIGWHVVGEWLIAAGIDALEGSTKTNGY